MTLAATRAKLEQAARRESQSAAGAAAVKRLPPARVVGSSGFVIGVADPARRATSSAASLKVDVFAESSTSALARQTLPPGTLKPLLRLHQELAHTRACSSAWMRPPQQTCLVTPSKG